MRLPCPTSTVRPVSSERHAPDRGREAGWRAGLSGRAVPRGCPGVRRVDRGGRQRAFRRSFATLQPRMIVPRLTPLRVTLGTIASRGAAVGVRHAGRSSSADPTSHAVSARAACGIFWLSRSLPLAIRVVATDPVAPEKSPPRDGPRFAHGRASLVNERSPLARRQPGMAGSLPERLTGARSRCAEEDVRHG